MNVGSGPFTSVACLSDPAWHMSLSALAANGDLASDPETAMEPRIATRGAFEHTGGVLAAETRPYSRAR